MSCLTFCPSSFLAPCDFCLDVQCLSMSPSNTISSSSTGSRSIAWLSSNVASQWRPLSVGAVALTDSELLFRGSWRRHEFRGVSGGRSASWATTCLLFCRCWKQACVEAWCDDTCIGRNQMCKQEYKQIIEYRIKAGLRCISKACTVNSVHEPLSQVPKAQQSSKAWQFKGTQKERIKQGFSACCNIHPMYTITCVSYG